MNTGRESEMRHIIESYGDLLYRTAYVLLGNSHDVQDVIQEALIKYMEKSPDFSCEEHRKAWLLKVTSNLCKDLLRFNKRHSCLCIDELEGICSVPEDRETLKEILLLPPKYKAVLLLHYAEGYQLKEIAGILGISENAVKKRIQRGKDALKQKLNNRQAAPAEKRSL